MSIVRFAGTDGRVEFVDGGRNKVRRAKPDDPMFCAQRAWDHRTEVSFMKEIEDNFQQIVTSILAGESSELGRRENARISEFYALWHFRSRRRMLPEEFLGMKGVTGTNLTKDEHEILESKGVVALRHDGTMPARHINGVQLRIMISRFASDGLADAHWGVVFAHDGEFCVPDVPEHGIIPISPNICLVKGSDGGVIARVNLAAINRALVSMSREYFFARALESCPM